MVVTIAGLKSLKLGKGATMPRGGRREPGPGKELGRPKKKDAKQALPYRVKGSIVERLREMGPVDGPKFLEEALEAALKARE